MATNVSLETIGHELAEGRLHLAFVRCWLHFRSDFPAFQQAETEVLQDRDYQSLKSQIDGLLLENEPLRLRNFAYSKRPAGPLVLLEVLDRFLFERYGAHGPGLPTPVRIGTHLFYIHRRVLAYSRPPRHAQQTGHLQSWLRHHWIIPARIAGIDICIRPASLAHVSMDDCWGRQQLKLFVTSFPDGVKPQWNVAGKKTSGKKGWVAVGLNDPDLRWRNALDSLQGAMKAEADIVVFPELTLCPDLRRKVSEWLNAKDDNSFLLVLPGSFHEWLDGPTIAGTYNRAVLLSGSGKPILSHCKSTTWGERDFFEAIQSGKCVELLDTPLGLIGIPICRDFCEEGAPFSHLWEEIGAEWLLVPSFGGPASLNAHRRRAAALSRSHAAITAVANQNPEGKEADHGFVCHGEGETGPLRDGGPTVCVAVPLARKGPEKA